MEARLTLAGIVAYRPDLFDNMVLPEPPENASAIGLQADQLRAAWTISKPDLVEFICLETMSMSLAFPDADFLKNAIGTWSKAHIHEWQRMFDTLFFKYNPLWNKDGRTVESGTDTHNQLRSESGTGGGNVIAGVTDHVHGYNQPSSESEPLWSPSEKSDTTSSTATTTTMNISDSVTDGFTHTTTEQGNIGVTMSQELITKERELAMFCIDEFIADAFKKQFCIMIW